MGFISSVIFNGWCCSWADAEPPWDLLDVDGNEEEYSDHEDSVSLNLWVHPLNMPNKCITSRMIQNPSQIQSRRPTLMNHVRAATNYTIVGITLPSAGATSIAILVVHLVSSSLCSNTVVSILRVFSRKFDKSKEHRTFVWIHDQ